MKLRRIKPVHLAWIAAFVVFDLIGLWFWLRSDGGSRSPGLAPGSPLERMAGDVRGLFGSDDAAGSARQNGLPDTDDSQPRYDYVESGHGRLDILVLDEVTRAPLAGVQCLVYSERGGEKLHAKCITNADGRASAENLPANTILVEARRTETHAEGFAGVWLKLDQIREVVIRVGAGETAVGRVVDDTGAPIAGAELLLDEDMATLIDGYQDVRTSKAVSAVSGPDGRFEIPHLAPRPGNVWIVNGEMRPEGWSGPSVVARKGGATGSAFIRTLKPGEIASFGDIVVDRPRTWRGHVVDARGARVEGALVTLREDRNHAFESHWDGPDALWPGLDGFRLEPGEVLTAADGSFAIEGFQERTPITIWPRTGIQEVFTVAALAPGATSSDLELRIKDWSMLEVEVVDAQGARVGFCNPRFPDVGFGAMGFSPVRIELSGAREAVGWLKPSRGDAWHARFEGSFDGLDHLRVAVPGYFEAHHAFTAPIANGEHVRLTLIEAQTIRLHISLAKQDRGPKKYGRAAFCWVSACLLSAEQRKASHELGLDTQCCGFDCELHKDLPEGESDVELPALTDKPLWIYVGVRGANGTWSGSFGPFAAGPAVHAIDIPKIDPALFIVFKSPFGEVPDPTPPASSQPDESDARGGLVFRVVDWKSGEPIPYAFATVRAASANPKYMPLELQADVAGRITEQWIPAGTLDLVVSARGYKSSSAISVTVRANEPTNLGSISLEAAPAPRIQVLRITEADGAAIDEGAGVQIIDPQSLKAVDVKAFNDGRVVLPPDLPERFFVRLSEFRSDALNRQSSAIQVIAVTRGSTDLTTARLAPWCEFEVRIGGAITEFPRSAVRVTLRRSTLAADPDTEALDAASAFVSDEIEPLADGRRRFRAFVAAGSFVVETASVLFTIPNARVEVRKLAELQTFELSSAH
jgi:hypothetical protein